MNTLRKHDWSRTLLWTIYLALLGVLLPHTSWAFSQFEPPGWAGLGWVAAVAFEGAIAAFTWRLKQRIEATPKFRTSARRRRFAYRYLNVNSLGLLVAIAVSSAANWAHSVQFGQTFAVFVHYGIPPVVYSVAFGGILPLCSLLFARILADVQDTEGDADPELLRVKEERDALRRQLRDQGQALTLAEGRANRAEDGARFLLELAAEDKSHRILAARRQWPQLPQGGIAVITGTSPAYVSEVLRALESAEVGP